VALAKRASHEQQAHLFSGAVLIASGVMYLRLTLLLALFNRALVHLLALPFLLLAGVAILVGWRWSRIPDAKGESPQREFRSQNPLELRAALLFATLFLVILVATRLAAVYLGSRGVFVLAAIMGVTDVDPFILGMAQSAGRMISLPIGAVSVLVAAASNNLIKGIYAHSFADRKTGAQSFGLLAGLAVIGLAPLLWLWR
jgi:uncharacterized membrane protein (DUF4010 family)